MKIRIVLKNGQLQTVREEDTLQFMIVTGQIHSFKRADGWVVIGRDDIRRGFSSYLGRNRRKGSFFARVGWN